MPPWRKYSTSFGVSSSTLTSKRVSRPSGLRASTLRVAYGKVEPYEPVDGVEYKYYTTLEGIMEKAAMKEGIRFAAEVFSDRTYTDEGRLTPRTDANAAGDLSFEK